MRYFAKKGGLSKVTEIEKKVLSPDLNMEAFGNAKKIKNDNSSRFGKFIQIDYYMKYKIAGASMKTY